MVLLYGLKNVVSFDGIWLGIGYRFEVGMVMYLVNVLLWFMLMFIVFGYRCWWLVW